MKEKLFLTGMLVLALTLGVLAAGCDNGGDSEGGNGGYETGDLPVSVGANAVDGKMYFSLFEHIEFSVEADGVSNGAYKVLSYTSYGMPYQESKSGAYSWNETTQTITLKPERVAIQWFDTIYGSFESKAEYRVSLQAMLNQHKEQWGEEKFNRYLSISGFSSTDAYLDYDVVEAFDNRMYNYDFSTDNATLFLAEVVPANKGSDELVGQTYNEWQYNEDYNYTQNPNRVYTFTASGYTYTDTAYPPNNNSGTYTYDSVSKRVWLKPYTTNRQTQYDVLVGSSSYSSESAAEDINYLYGTKQCSYNTMDKTIVRLR
jgi:hypothetical protein